MAPLSGKRRFIDLAVHLAADFAVDPVSIESAPRSIGRAGKKTTSKIKSLEYVELSWTAPSLRRPRPVRSVQVRHASPDLSCWRWPGRDDEKRILSSGAIKSVRIA
jgi:hypothetical protein